MTKAMRFGAIAGLTLFVGACAVFFGGETNGAATDEDPVSITWGILDVGSGIEFDASIPGVESYLSTTTGYDVTIRTYDAYGDIKDAMAGSDPILDMATLPTFTYLVAEEESGVELVLAAVRFGATTYRSQFVTRTGSGITEIADLAGSNFMRPDPLSTSGWIIPEITMRAEGIDITGLTVVDGAGHDSVIRGVYDGQYDDGSGDPPVTVDAGATFVDARSTVEDNPDYSEVYTTVAVIGTSIDIPNDCIAVHPSLDSAVREGVVEAIVDGFAGDAASAFETMTGWSAVQQEDPSFYNDFTQLLQDAGVDPADYVE